MGTKSERQSLLPVYMHAMLYYDSILSYFALIFQYPQFIYKYNILFYSSSTITAELMLLSLLLLANPLRIGLGRSGSKGRQSLKLLGFVGLDVLLVVGYVYVLGMQSNALYLESIIAILALIFAAASLVLGIVLLIYYGAKA